MNTGPIIGGTRDGEQFSHADNYAKVPALLQISANSLDHRLPTTADMMINDIEQLRWVPFFFTFFDRDVKTGFWVSLTPETQRFHDDAEFRLYVLMKLSERYSEPPILIKKRLRDRLNAGRY